MNTNFPKIQINFSSREAGSQILETTFLGNIRGDDLSECMALYEALKERLNCGSERKENKADKVVLEFLNKNQKTCPECGGNMILRTSKNGKHPGSRFFGCSRYPICGATLPA